MHALYSVAEIRQIEKAVYACLPPASLMRRAGKAAADTALSLLLAPHANARVLVLAGPGNNGGDALEAAAHLAHAGLNVTVVLHADSSKQSDDARQALQRAAASPARFVDLAAFANSMQTPWSLVIDGLFGIGLQRPIGEPLRTIVEWINTLSCPVLALDVPSGLDADSGDIVGPDGVAVRASHTITFIGDKPGLHTCWGRDHAGSLQVAALDIEAALFPSGQCVLNGPEIFSNTLRPRQQNSHKGSFGNVILIGGATGMSGAPVLAARAAAKCGAGRVYIGFLDSAPPYDFELPELMFRSAGKLCDIAGVLVVGPGLGSSHDAQDSLLKAIAADAALVLDADALNLLAADADLRQRLASRKIPALITPHPLEAARLLSLSASQIQADRPTAARELARRLNAIVILKGSGTVIARPDGYIAINPTGNAALASAGTGDVLAGVCGALLAQSVPAWEAALMAVWLHGHAADILVDQGNGPIGLTAGELIPAIRSALNRLPQSGRRDLEPN